jgi:hypothetical protein
LRETKEEEKGMRQSDQWVIRSGQQNLFRDGVEGKIRIIESMNLSIREEEN